MFNQTMRTATPDQTRSLEATSQVSVSLPVREAFAAGIKRIRTIDWDRVHVALINAGPGWYVTDQLAKERPSRNRKHDDVFPPHPWED